MLFVCLVLLVQLESEHITEREAEARNLWVNLKNVSNSMYPCVPNTATVIERKYDENVSIKMGQIVSYRQDNETNVIHRVIGRFELNNKTYYITKGDRNNIADQPITADNITGVAIGVDYQGNYSKGW